MKRYHSYYDGSLIYSENNYVVIKDKTIVLDEILTDHFALIKRLLRKDIHFVKLYDRYIIICIKKKILIYEDFKLVKIIKLRGSRVLRNGVSFINNYMFFGDYISNKDRENVYIYKVNLNTLELNVFFTFNNVRHVHFIVQDKIYNDKLIVGTGDKDQESKILIIDVYNKEVEVLREGKQDYRAVSILQVDNYLIWGSDDPDDDNYIFRLDRFSKKLEKLKKIDGPAYYSAQDKKGYLYIASTIEDRKRHKAIIYISKDNGNSWEIYKKFKKDIWHTKYFGYGIVEFFDKH